MRCNYNMDDFVIVTSLVVKTWDRTRLQWSKFSDLFVGCYISALTNEKPDIFGAHVTIISVIFHLP